MPESKLSLHLSGLHWDSSLRSCNNHVYSIHLKGKTQNINWLVNTLMHTVILYVHNTGFPPESTELSPQRGGQAEHCPAFFKCFTAQTTKLYHFEVLGEFFPMRNKKKWYFFHNRLPCYNYSRECFYGSCQQQIRQGILTLLSKSNK